MWHGVPRVVAEVLSTTDRVGNVNDRVAALLAAGVSAVRVADSGSRTLTVHRVGETPRAHRGGDVVEGGDALPGFRAPAAALFAPDRPPPAD